MSDNPSATFFFKDWLTDLALHRCSFEQHGLWLFMLCFAHNPDPDFGFVVMPGGEREIDAIAFAIAELRVCHADRIAIALHDMHKKGVFSLDERGFVYCRRMVRDGKTAKIRSAAGQKGAAARWGNDKKVKRKTRSHRQNDSTSHNTGHTSGHANGNAKSMAENASSFSLLHTPIKDTPLPPLNGKTDNLSDTQNQAGESLAPASSVRPSQSLAERARADAEVFANTLGVTLTADASRMHWPDTLARAVEVEGLSWDRHILPAARETRAKGKASIAYALAVARSYRDTERGPVNGTSATVQPAGVVLPEDGDAGWRQRLRLCVSQAREHGEDQRKFWPLTWGPFPFTESGGIEPTTLVPVHILQGIIDGRKRQA